MKIEFVNHASFILESGDVRLITDPWLEGTCFNDGWGLLSPTALKYEEFGSITHLWFSHEHPDHFHPPSLRKIPEAARRNITVLFQATGDRKVVDFCRIMKFKDVIEMPSGKAFDLGSGVQITCCPWEGYDDSWTHIRTPGGTILNLNDCIVNSPQEMQSVKDRVGDVDVLLTQFSISAWDGNVEELDRRLLGARKMLDRTWMQANVMQARHLIPFASFIWFCHEENAYMNEAFLPLEEVVATLREKSAAKTVLMYPGDVWEVGAPHDTDAALKRYAADQATIPTRPRVTSRPAFEKLLITESYGFCGKVLANAHRSKLRIHFAKDLPRYRRQRQQKWSMADRIRAFFAMVTLHCEPARLYLTDYGRSYELDIFHGLRPANFKEEQCDVALSSDSLMYSFKNLWGGETLHINGRFRRILAHDRGPLFHFYSIAGEQNADEPITWRDLPGDLARRLRHRREKRRQKKEARKELRKAA